MSVMVMTGGTLWCVKRQIVRLRSPTLRCLSGQYAHADGLVLVDEPVEALVGDGNDGLVGLDGAEREVLGRDVELRQAVEERRLAHVRHAHDADLDVVARAAQVHARHLSSRQGRKSTRRVSGRHSGCGRRSGASGGSERSPARHLPPG